MQRTQSDEIIYRVVRPPAPSGRGVRARSGVVHYDNVTAIPERWITDTRLSVAGHWLLLCIASRRDDDLPTFDDLVPSNGGAAELRTALAELDRVGYLVRHADGRFSVRDASLRVVA